MVFLGPGETFALANDVEPLDLVEQIVFKLVDFDPELFVVQPEGVKLCELLLQVLLLLGNGPLEALSSFLQFNARLSQFSQLLLRVLVAVHAKPVHLGGVQL